jgi:hypothetical protein
MREAVLDHFQRVLKGSSCLYARGTRLWGADPWQPGEGLAVNAAILFDNVAEFLERAAAEKLDGILFEIGEAGYGDDLDQLCDTTRVLLTCLAERDPTGNAMVGDIADPGWWFTLMGTALFVSVFAPCYPPSSSRYVFGADSTFFLFLTDDAFARRRAAGAGQWNGLARERIRREHEIAGRRYDLSITAGPLEALRYVKPLRLGDLPVLWWIDPSNGDFTTF